MLARAVPIGHGAGEHMRKMVGDGIHFIRYCVALLLKGEGEAWGEKHRRRTG